MLPSSVSLLKSRTKLITKILYREYGSPRHGNKLNPLDELVFIILSVMTTHHSFNKVYKKLKTEVKSWDALTSIKLTTLKKIIKDGGLSGQKAKRLIHIMRRLKEDLGRATLAPLRHMTNYKAENYLKSLPGVGTKVAKCVLMYSFNRKVLPVDTHVYRIAIRLSLIKSLVPFSKIHVELEKVVPPGDRYTFHVNAISHGREICRAIKPRCGDCPILHLCPFPHKSL